MFTLTEDKINLRHTEAEQYHPPLVLSRFSFILNARNGIVCNMILSIKSTFVRGRDGMKQRGGRLCLYQWMQ